MASRCPRLPESWVLSSGEMEVKPEEVKFTCSFRVSRVSAGQATSW